MHATCPVCVPSAGQLQRNRVTENVIMLSVSPNADDRASKQLFVSELGFVFMLETMRAPIEWGVEGHELLSLGWTGEETATSGIASWTRNSFSAGSRAFVNSSARVEDQMT